MRRRWQLGGLSGAERLRRWMALRPSSLRGLGPAGQGDAGSTESPWRPDDVDLPMGEGGYALVARLSVGGMAELFLACRRGPAGIAHPVVVKRLRPEARRSPSIVRMFLWEAWISARLHHPNIVRFHDFVFHEGRHHLVIEYVPGCDLAVAARSFFAEERAFPIEVAIEIGIGVLRALGHAHALRDDSGSAVGLVHRDVSPQNVLLSLEGEIKLIDFGVAKTSGAAEAKDAERPGPWAAGGGAVASTGAGTVKGKLGYVAPEQLRGERVDARADLFAVGVILFELLTGRRLFYRRDEGATMHAVLSGEVPAIAPLRPACPALLEEVVRRALARDPEGRFDDAAHMEEALAEVLASLRRASGERGEPTSSERGPFVSQGLAALVREIAGARDRHRPLLHRPSRRSAARDGRSALVRRAAPSEPREDRSEPTESAPAPSGAGALLSGERGAPSERGGAVASATPPWTAGRRSRRCRILPWVLVVAVTFAAGVLTARAIGARGDGAAARPRGAASERRPSAESARSRGELHSTPPR